MAVLPIVPPLAALVLFATWALVLATAIGTWRATQFLAGRKRANEFPSTAPHGGDVYGRLDRAHANAAENLPIFGALVLSGIYLQVDDLAFQILPSLVLYARIAQSVIHLASGSAAAVTLRFAAYVVQVAAMLAIAAVVLRRAGLPMPW